MDNVSEKKRSEIMRKIKSSNSIMEELFCKDLAKKRYKFKRNVKNLVGKPDVVFKKKRVAIFLDSCFWHGCKIHCRMPSSKRKYWLKKIDGNIKRNEEVNKIYRKKDWKVLRFWEHEIKKSPNQCIDKILKILKL